MFFTTGDRLCNAGVPHHLHKPCAIPVFSNTELRACVFVQIDSMRVHLSFSQELLLCFSFSVVALRKGKEAMGSCGISPSRLYTKGEEGS